MANSFFDDLIETSQERNWDIKYEYVPKEEGYSLKMIDQWHPFSVKIAEWEYINQFVHIHGLKNGYEIATGFGISALAAARAMPEFGGKLVTMDAYVEELYGDCGKYNDGVKRVGDTTRKGYRSIKQLIQHFGLETTLFPYIGWSPDDTTQAISSVFGPGEKLEYVFVDGLHTVDAVIKDLTSVLPYLNREKYAIFLHDSFMDYGQIRAFLGEQGLHLGFLIPECDGKKGFGLGLSTSIKL
jgi:hypothetical protein